MLHARNSGHLSFALVLSSLLVVAAVLLPAVASANEDPLRLSFVNAAAKGGEASWKTIQGFLDKSGDIETTSPDKLWDVAKKYDLAEKDFRSSSLRAKNEREFRMIMKELDIEAILIQDVFSRGRKFQLVVIGPGGTEVADVRKDIKRGRLSKSQARDVLKSAFKELVPNVRDFRDAGGWDAVDDEEEEEEVEEGGLISGLGGGDDEERDEAGDEDDDVSLKDKVVAKKKGSAGGLEGYSLSAGLLIGKRTLLLQGNDSGFELNHESPFAGVGGRLDGILTQIGDDSAIGFAVFGGYAPFTTIFDQAEQYASAYARLGAEVSYIKAFSPQFRLEVAGGAEAVSVTIAQNVFYTGNRYIAGRLGAGIGYVVGPVLLRLSGAVLPVFNTNNSDGAYGDPGMSLGFEPAAGLAFSLTDDLKASLGYSLQLFQPDYPESAVLNETATSSDTIHTGMISIGYGI